MNHIEDTWNEGKKTAQKCGLFFVQKTGVLWPLCHMLGVQLLALILIFTPKLSLCWDKCSPWLKFKDSLHCIKDAMP
jgi:hypothetical protein